MAAKAHGVRDLARATGMDSTTVSRKLRQGMTEEEIREQARNWAGRNKVQGRNKRVVSEATLKTLGKSYVPARRASTPTGPGPAVVDKLAASVVVPVETEKRTRRKKAASDSENLPVEFDTERGEYTINGETYKQAELRKMVGAANLQDIKAAQLRKELVYVERINRYIGGAHVKFRDVLFRIPDERSDALMMEDDPIKFRAMLMEALVQACGQLRVLTADPIRHEDVVEAEAEIEETE